jgi:hypothetical protein
MEIPVVASQAFHDTEGSMRPLAIASAVLVLGSAALRAPETIDR